MFNSNQDSYISLRNIISERTGRLIAWVGAGISAPAGLPTWQGLKDEMCDVLKRKAESFEDEKEKNGLLRIEEYARKDSDLWNIFDLLKEKIGQATYQGTIKKIFSKSSNCAIPDYYKEIWKLPIDGILTLNLDKLAARAFNEIHTNLTFTPFNGSDAGKFCHLLKENTQFITYIHGHIEDSESWVFGKQDLNKLWTKTGYTDFIKICLTTRTVIFLGISADDIAITKHLKTLQADGISYGNLYWITNQSDREVDLEAEDLGMRIIRYNTRNGNHEELHELLNGLLHHKNEDDIAPPVQTTLSHENNDYLPTPTDIITLDPENIRQILNAEASRILKSNNQEAYNKYEAFCKKYGRAIQLAWYVDINPPDNMIFGYKIIKEIAEGGFGRVFLAKSPKNENVAVKLLKEDVRRKSDMLQSFRRGVRSMQILDKYSIDGMVSYKETSEIPASTIMAFIEGPNLYEAVKSKYCDEWKDVLYIATILASILKNAHSLPERVLHRDIRPANIMLKNYYTNPTTFEVVLLDFDLSWHRDAVEKSILNTTINGYLAPEQIEKQENSSTRNALVDSFGLGMTLFFLRTGKEPLFMEHKHIGWNSELEKSICKYQCSTWKSLPIRFARLISLSTRHKQFERLDMSQILRELELLKIAVEGKIQLESSEMIAEELAKRLCDNIGTGRGYQWLSDKKSACIQLLCGVEIEIKPLDTEKKVEVSISWIKKEGNEYRNIRKFLKPACERSISILKSKKWIIFDSDIESLTMVKFNAKIDSCYLAMNFDDHSMSIALAMKELDFD